VSGRALLTAAVTGYEAGIRIGEFLGQSHYRVFHTTGTVGTLAAAVGTAKILKLNTAQTLDSVGNAGTQAAGLWQFLGEAADSKQLHTAKASADGLLSAYLAKDGLTGAHRILDGAQGMAAGMSQDSDPARLTDGLGTRWAIAETSFKIHASCRHTHPAADALEALMRREGLRETDLVKVVAHVHGAAITVLGKVSVPTTVHQAKFSMGTVLALLAVHGRAGVDEFEQFALTDARVADFRDRVQMIFDADVDRAYPSRWLGRVSVITRDGRSLEASIDQPRGDPGKPPTRAELEEKFRRLARFSGVVSADEADQLISSVWRLRHVSRVSTLPC
jgi:2-methylcitrate dehydratase PrpD